MRKWKFALDNPCKPLLNVCGNFPCVNVSWNLYNIGQLHDGVTLFLLREFLATHRVQIKSVKEVLKSCEATESFGVVLFLTGITGCLPFTKSFPENPAGNQMEHCFSSRSIGKFPGATEHLKRWSCQFSGRNIPNGNSCSISPKPSLIPVSGVRSLCSNWTDWKEIYQSWILPTICPNHGPAGLPM